MIYKPVYLPVSNVIYKPVYLPVSNVIYKPVYLPVSNVIYKPVHLPVSNVIYTPVYLPVAVSNVIYKPVYLPVAVDLLHVRDDVVRAVVRGVGQRYHLHVLHGPREQLRAHRHAAVELLRPLDVHLRAPPGQGRVQLFAFPCCKSTNSQTIGRKCFI